MQKSMCARIKHRNDSKDTEELTISSGKCQWLKQQIKSMVLLSTSHKSLELSHFIQLTSWGTTGRKQWAGARQGQIGTPQHSIAKDPKLMRSFRHQLRSTSQT